MISKKDIHVIEKSGHKCLIYSHDDGFTIHSVKIFDDRQYTYMINGSECFSRRTHIEMLRAYLSGNS